MRVNRWPDKYHSCITCVSLSYCLGILLLIQQPQATDYVTTPLFSLIFIDYIFSYYRSQKQTFGLVQSLLSNHSFQRCWRFRSQPLLHKLLGLWWHHSCTLTERWEVFFFRGNKNAALTKKNQRRM